MWRRYMEKKGSSKWRTGTGIWFCFGVEGIKVGEGGISLEIHEKANLNIKILRKIKKAEIKEWIKW